MSVGPRARRGGADGTKQHGKPAQRHGMHFARRCWARINRFHRSTAPADPAPGRPPTPLHGSPCTPSRTTCPMQPFCVLLIDIDHFKQINDSVGHFVGDKVLVRSVLAIKEVLRSSDLFSRWGGEEFLIVMPGIALPAVRDITSRIHRCIESIDFSDLGFYARVTVSIGVAERHANESLEDLLSSADKALYRAKENGRNRSEFRLTSAWTSDVIGL